MSKPVRVGAVHALAHSAEPTAAAFASAWPQAQIAHLSDGSLYLDRSQGTADEAEITRRIDRLIQHSAACGAQGVIFTGSFFGDSVRAVRGHVDVPVLTSFEGIIEKALTLECPICVLSTAADSTGLLADEIQQTAAERGISVQTRQQLVDGAMDALNAGDAETHNRLVLEAIRGVEPGHAVAMAQFTMERVIQEAQALREQPVIGPASEGAIHLRNTLS